jgi:ribosomal-protein-alanine N-acetyltransferase
VSDQKEMEISIRDALPEDTDAIAALEDAVFPIPWSPESILHDIEGNPVASVLVAEADGKFAGYADIWCIAGEAQLNNIAVDPGMRGRGVGLKLMNELISRTVKSGMTELSLEVRPSNTAALSLYKKLGFTECGRRKKYYADNGEDALIMKIYA